MNATTIFATLKGWWEKVGIDEFLFKPFHALGIEEHTPKTFLVIISMILFVYIIKKVMDWLLKTEAGIALRATGDNARMVKSLSANTNTYIVVGLGLSNGLVALSGAIFVQYSGFSDLNAGVGMIVVGLASVIIGEGLFGKKKIARITLAVILGAIIYRIIIALALQVDFLEASDMKLISAIIVIIALILPIWTKQVKENKKRSQNKKNFNVPEEKGDEEHASTKEHP